MAAKKAAPLVSIVILNWNGLEDTKLCLEHVRKLDYPNYEVIVVDNGSSQDQKEYLSKLKDIIYVDNPKNRGFAGGQADGYRHSKGEFILLLNNDAVIDSNYIKEALPLFADKKVGVVGGRSYFWSDEEKLFDKSNRFYSYMNIDPISAETNLQMHDYSTVQEVNTVSGSAAIVRRSIVEQIGYLWEPFFAYYEETDLFSRVKRAGYKVLYNPKLQIWHKNGASSGAQGGSFFFYYHIFRNRYMYATRNFDEDYLRLFRKSFYQQARLAVAGSTAGQNQRRYAHGYTRAIASIQRQKNKLKGDRKKLAQEFPEVKYNQQIIKEQTTLSVVVDCTELSIKKSLEFAKKLSVDKNPLHEYLLVTHHDESALSGDFENARFVVDKQYFTTHPINLGCLSAQYDWLALCSHATIRDIDYYLTAIADSYIKRPSVINIGSGTALIKKRTYELMGGLHESPDSLEENVDVAIRYAAVKKELVADTIPEIDAKLRHEVIAQIQADNELLSEQQFTSRWERLVSRYYRLQQLRNLTKWTVSPSISLRHKAGRTRNLILSTASLDRERLATELKHIRNEVYLQSTRQKNARVMTSPQKQSDKFVRSQLSSLSNIPVFIICFERADSLKILVKKLEAMGLRKIVFIDNDSTHSPLLDYFNRSPYQKLYLRRNAGHTAPWTQNIVRTLIPYGYYIVTDPDVIPTDECIAKQPIEHLIKIHQKYPTYQKVGFGLKIDDLPDHYPLKNDVVAWETQFWKTEIEPGVFEAGVDTTFALYKPCTYLYTLHPSLRTGEPYVARHIPWYNDPAKQTAEDIYYKLRANADVTSWNVDELPDRYKKEMSDA